MRWQDQMQAWRFGVPLHNIEKNQCCPDFACCRPDGYLATREERETFVTSGWEVREHMLMGWLRLIMEEKENKVYIPGETEAGIQ